MRKSRKIVIVWFVIVLPVLLSGMEVSAENFTQKAAYEYDVNGRLCRVKYTDGSVIQYVYDKNGNIVAVQTMKKEDGKLPESTEEKTSWQKTMGENIRLDSGGNQWTGDGRLLKKKMAQEMKKLKIQKLVNPMVGKRIRKIQKTKAKIKKTRQYQNGNVEVTLKKIPGCTGYEIKYSVDKNFKGAKLIRGKKTARYLKLKNGKTYYIKARGYYTSHKRRFYTQYSKVRKIKVKK